MQFIKHLYYEILYLIFGMGNYKGYLNSLLKNPEDYSFRRVGGGIIHKSGNFYFEFSSYHKDCDVWVKMDTDSFTKIKGLKPYQEYVLFKTCVKLHDNLLLKSTNNFEHHNDYFINLVSNLPGKELKSVFNDLLKELNHKRITDYLEERLVCAANRIYNTKEDPNKEQLKIILCTRHGDPFYHEIHDLYGEDWEQLDQGFVTNKRRFVSREEALEIAKKNNQILRLSSSPNPNILFSEDLY